MNWYLAKIVYQIICDKGLHTPQFDEQLRLIYAEDNLHAFYKARLLGEHEEDSFLNKLNKPICWKFIDVSEIHKLDNLVDGAEMYSKINEETNPEIFIRNTRLKATQLLEDYTLQFIKLN
ncbi:MAG TPA: DUF4288 domain-containing protein [Chitinophagaceae bacterium]|nr:DUF4288 domain-containing protein [Bacteroidota bacterium]HEX3025054.1 DUF4288 domain-containing protein [Chitinophagaceae bacterium]